MFESVPEARGLVEAGIVTEGTEKDEDEIRLLSKYYVSDLLSITSLLSHRIN